MESIIITQIRKSTNRIDIDIKLSKGIEKFFLPEKHFFAEYSCDISCVPESVLIVPLLINLILFSWLADCIVWVPSVAIILYFGVILLLGCKRTMIILNYDYIDEKKFAII